MTDPTIASITLDIRAHFLAADLHVTNVMFEADEDAYYVATDDGHAFCAIIYSDDDGTLAFVRNDDAMTITVPITY